jgi:serine/threonine protein kinase
VLGTPRYMSPEQIKTEKLDGRSDIYSLGVVLFEMVAGREPFPGDHIAAVTYKQLMEPVPLLPAETAFLQPVVARMMAKERSTRPGSEEEWRLLVRPVLRPFTLPRVAAVKVPRVPPEERQPTRISPSRKNPPKKRRSQANRRPGKTSRWRWHLALIGVLVAFFLFNLDLLPGWGRAAWAWLSALVKSAMPPPP